MPSVTKKNVVSPAISIGSCAWWVSTKTGWWYGGSGPHPPLPSLSPPRPRARPHTFGAPDLPVAVAPRAADRPEHVAAHDRRPDVLVAPAREVVVHACLAAALAGHGTPE